MDFLTQARATGTPFQIHPIPRTIPSFVNPVVLFYENVLPLSPHLPYEFVWETGIPVQKCGAKCGMINRRSDIMRRSLASLSPLPLCMLLLTGCGPVGEKAASMAVVYGVSAILSLLLLVGYCRIAKKRDSWYLLLFVSVLIVNIGYFALAISQSLDEALLANRISYFGSVFLPLSMLMIIINATHIQYRKWLTTVLLSLAVVVFLIAASPGYLPIYYKDVSFVIEDGVATLQKVYGPLHVLYLVYLLGYFAAMVSTIVYATVKDKIDSLAHAVIIAIAVFVNIGVWLIEQLVYIPFEVLSVSYVISESFLLGLHILMAEAEKLKLSLIESQETPPQGAPVVQLPDEVAQPDPDQVEREKLDIFVAGLSQLTHKEQELFNCYVAGLTTDVIMEQLNIKENTLKFHSKNIYSKLGVKSRKQLMELHNRTEKKSHSPQ